MSKIITLLLIGLLSFSCATSKKTAIESDRRDMRPLLSKGEMVSRISKSLDQIPGITQEQRDGLKDIHAEVMTKSWDINQKIREYKILLFRYLAADKYDAQKVKYTKKMIEKNYAMKLSLMLRSFEKVKKLLGKDARKIFEGEEFMHLHKERF